MTKLLRLLTLALLAALAAGRAPARAAGPTTLAVEPIQVFNVPDVAAAAPGLQAALASRLSGPGTRVSTPAQGAAVDAAAPDWHVRTTITRLGTKLTLDAALEPRDPARGTRRAFQTADSADDLLSALDALAASLKAELAAAAPEAPAPVVAPVAPAPVATPAPVAAPAAAPASALAPLQAGANAELAQAFLRYRTGPSLPGQARGLAVADVDRDGAAEVLVLVEDHLHAFRDDAGELRPAWSFPVKDVPNPSLLSVGDADGDGVPDVFVAGLSDDKVPLTRAYQWTGDALTAHGPPLQALARAVRHPTKGVQLLGLVAGIGKDLFSPNAMSFSWQDGGYRKQGPFSLPLGLTPINLDWCDCGPDGRPIAAATTDASAFRVYDESFKELYQSDEEVKGTATTLFGDIRSLSSEEADFLRVGARTAFYKGPDGTVQWLLHRNHGFMARVFERSASFTHGQLLALRWDGLTLVPTAVGPKLPGYIADLDLGPTPGASGRQTLYAALVQSEGVWNVKRTTRLLSMNL